MGVARIRAKPTADTVLFKDRLLYLLQPPLDGLFEGRQLEVPFEPYPYQLEGIAFLMPRHGALLADETIHGKIVMEKGILYAPDFVVNAGGLINVYSEVAKYGREAALAQAENIYNTTAGIYAMSKKDNIPTYMAANRTAEARIAAMAHIRTKR